MRLLKSKSFWYFMAVSSGLCVLVSALCGHYGWAMYNAVALFIGLHNASKAPNA